MSLKEGEMWFLFSATMLFAGCEPSDDVILPDASFKKERCSSVGVRVSVPVGWYLTEKPSSPIAHNLTEAKCFITRDPLQNGQEFITGMSITKVEKLPLGIADVYARAQAANFAGSYDKKTVGALEIHESRFISTSNNLVSDQWVAAVNVGGDVFVVLFTTPQTSSQADFNQFGSQMFADLRINGLPIKEHTTS